MEKSCVGHALNSAARVCGTGSCGHRPANDGTFEENCTCGRSKYIRGGCGSPDDTRSSHFAMACVPTTRHVLMTWARNVVSVLPEEVIDLPDTPPINPWNETEFWSRDVWSLTVQMLNQYLLQPQLVPEYVF